MRTIKYLLLITLISFGCAPDTEVITDLPEQEDPYGYLHYDSDINVRSRHQIIDGDYIAGSVALSYYSTPGAYDGDGGTSLVFKVINEKILDSIDIWIPFSSGALDAYYIEWASPAGYNWQSSDSMIGQYRIVEYNKFKNLIIELDLDPKDREIQCVNFRHE